MLIRAMILCAALIVQAQTAWAGVLADPVAAGNWSLFPAGDENGFQMCILSRKNDKGTRLGLSLDRDFRITMGLSAPAWVLDDGKRYPVDWKFDESDLWRGAAQAVDADAVRIVAAEEGRFFHEMRAAARLTFILAGGEISFDISDSDQPLDQLGGCVRDWKLKEFKALQNNPFLGLVLAGKDAPDDTIDRAAKMARALPALPAFSDILWVRVRGEDGFPKTDDYDAAWGGDDVFGGVQVFFTNGDDVETIAKRHLKAEMAGCEGRFASQSIALALPDLDLRRLHTQCSNGDQTNHAYYVLLRGEYLSAAVVTAPRSNFDLAVKWDDGLADLAAQALKGFRR